MRHPAPPYADPPSTLFVFLCFPFFSQLFEIEANINFWGRALSDCFFPQGKKGAGGEGQRKPVNMIC